MMLPFFFKATQVAVTVAEHPKEEFRVHYQKGLRMDVPTNLQGMLL